MRPQNGEKMETMEHMAWYFSNRKKKCCSTTGARQFVSFWKQRSEL